MAVRAAEIARLKGLKGRPDIRPSGMEQGTQAPSDAPAGPRRGGGNKTSRRTIHEDRVVEAAVPPGSRFKGYQSFVLQTWCCARMCCDCGANAGCHRTGSGSPHRCQRG